MGKKDKGEKKIVVRYSNEEPDDDEDKDKGADFFKRFPFLNKKKLKYKIQSVTRFELDGTGACEKITVVTVWRNETDLGPYQLSNMDLEEAVKGKVDHTAYAVIAKTLLALPRVAIVEAVDYSTVGEGIRLEKED
jgi:hypothetical protein